MPGDDMREDATVSAAAADAGRARSGPRHAAPRKPLLTRLHVPAGKAIAMAAMPSAVLMGMGLTPQLANAKQQPKNPFKGGPCVSAPDKEEEAEKKAEEKAEAEAKEKAAKEKAAKTKAAKEKAEREKAAKEKAEAAKPGSSEKPGSSDGSGSSDDSGSGSAPSGDSGTDTPEPEPEPSESESKNPLDPLGLGDALKDVLTPGEKAAKEKAEKEKAEEAEKEAAEKEAAKPDPEPSASGEDDGKDPVGDAVDKVEKGVEDTVDGVEKGAEDAKDKLPKPGASEDGDGEDKAGKDDEGKKPFPCVEEKKVGGTDEGTPATLPNQPWHLQASSLALHGLDYEGVVNVKMANGKSKQALKFTASSIDIGDLHQIVDGPNGNRYHVEAAKGSTSTIRDGQVTMYTERLQGNLFGLIPIVFDPEHPPPVNLPEVFFTKVKIQQAGQFGGTLTIPGLKQSITQ